MVRRLLSTVLVMVMGISTAWVQRVSGQGTAFDTDVRPVLARNCITCHSQELATANLNLELYQDEASAAKDPQVWDKVLAKLKAGQMPPPGMTALSKTEAAAVTRWIEALLSRNGSTGGPPLAASTP